MYFCTEHGNSLTPSLLLLLPLPPPTLQIHRCRDNTYAMFALSSSISLDIDSSCRTPQHDWALSISLPESRLVTNTFLNQAILHLSRTQPSNDMHPVSFQAIISIPLANVSTRSLDILSVASSRPDFQATPG